MRYIVTSVPHSHHRYETVGDWIVSHGQLRHVRVSEMGNEDYAFLVGLHEQIEAWLCMRRGITEEVVNAFDMAFEANRAEGNIDEPGDDPKAPYRREHRQAENIERQVADLLGVDWQEYEKAVASL